jgi:hypothetical protein
MGQKRFSDSVESGLSAFQVPDGPFAPLLMVPTTLTTSLQTGNDSQLVFREDEITRNSSVG